MKLNNQAFHLFNIDSYKKLRKQVLKADMGIYKKARCLSLIHIYHCERLEPPTFKTLKQMSRAQIARLIMMARKSKTRK